jgi:hypothetical protein
MYAWGLRGLRLQTALYPSLNYDYVLFYMDVTTSRLAFDEKCSVAGNGTSVSAVSSPLPLWHGSMANHWDKFACVHPLRRPSLTTFCRHDSSPRLTAVSSPVHEWHSTVNQVESDLAWQIPRASALIR